MKYKTEVKEKWGNTKEYKEHQEKTKDNSKEKWDSLNSEMDDILFKFSEILIFHILFGKHNMLIAIKQKP